MHGRCWSKGPRTSMDALRSIVRGHAGAAMSTSFASRHNHRNHPGGARWPVLRPARALCPAESDYHPRKQWRQAMMALAGPQIVTGGASAPPALQPTLMPRTITDGALARVEGGHAEAP